MIKKHFLLIALLQIVFASVVFSQDKQDLQSILPDSNSVEGWKPVGELERYKSDELFYLINGGADLYQECGFVEVIALSFRNGAEEKISIEIYKMESDSSALSIFTLSATKNAEKVEYGQMALATANSLIIWQDCYFIMLRSSLASESVTEGFKSFAKSITHNIKSNGKVPLFISEIIENKQVENYKYFRGSLGIATAYYFYSGNIFNVSEGISFSSDLSKNIYLIYSDNAIAKSTFISAIEVMEKASKFTLQDKTETELSFTDRKEKNITVTLVESEIVILIKD